MGVWGPIEKGGTYMFAKTTTLFEGLKFLSRKGLDKFVLNVKELSTMSIRLPVGHST